MITDDLIRRKDALDALALVVKTNTERYIPMYARKALKNIPTVDAVEVVFCKDCEYCNPLYFDPHGNYAGDGSFTCGENEIDYYAPDYHMDTYYCADGKRRTANDQSD